MNRYLQALLIFDVAAPALLIGLPCCALFWAVMTFQNFLLQKTVERDAYETRGREVRRTQRATGTDAGESLASENAFVD